jgi:hypothetical protein
VGPSLCLARLGSPYRFLLFICDGFFSFSAARSPRSVCRLQPVHRYRVLRNLLPQGRAFRSPAGSTVREFMRLRINGSLPPGMRCGKYIKRHALRAALPEEIRRAALFSCGLDRCSGMVLCHRRRFWVTPS